MRGVPLKTLAILSAAAILSLTGCTGTPDAGEPIPPPPPKPTAEQIENAPPGARKMMEAAAKQGEAQQSAESAQAEAFRKAQGGSK